MEQRTAPTTPSYSTSASLKRAIFSTADITVVWFFIYDSYIYDIYAISKITLLKFNFCAIYIGDSFWLWSISTTINNQRITK